MKNTKYFALDGCVYAFLNHESETVEAVIVNNPIWFCGIKKKWIEAGILFGVDKDKITGSLNKAKEAAINQALDWANDIQEPTKDDLIA